ncbi:MAG: accessory factor UbiK family protein [Gammaproteobacteria bacterium]
MIDLPIFDDFARRVADADAARPAPDEDRRRKNLRAILQNAFSKMNLVTREEFDVQQAVLARTRAKLDEMGGE